MRGETSSLRCILETTKNVAIAGFGTSEIPQSTTCPALCEIKKKKPKKQVSYRGLPFENV